MTAFYTCLEHTPSTAAWTFPGRLAAMADAGLIARIYHHTLGRSPDPAGTVLYAAALDGGLTASAPGRQAQQLPVRGVRQDIQRAIRALPDVASPRVQVSQQPFLAHYTVAVHHQPD